jgi:succinyl-CoA:acetate CoA-transferase
MKTTRVLNSVLRERIMSAREAAALIPFGSTIGMSGFTGAGYPKAIPLALAERISAAHEAGEHPTINVWTGASTAPELDGVLADAMEQRLPYQSDPKCRQRINSGCMQYLDIHLSEVAQAVTFGFFGKLDVAVVEVAGIREDGQLIPTNSVGNNKTWLEQADKIILEVNSWVNPALEGMHDIYYGTHLPPYRLPIKILKPDDRIGGFNYRCDLSKVIAVVETNATDRNSKFKEPDAISHQIAGHILDFFDNEVKHGRLPYNLLPIQSGVGNVPNAVMAGLKQSHYENLTAYTEVIQDAMLELIKCGKMSFASSTALSLSPEATEEFNRNVLLYCDRILLRPQEISNHPEVIRRLGVIAMNSLIEADIYGNVNSTHINGTSIMNGIGGSGDFARNSYLSIFMTPSTAKNGKITCIVPMVSHVDHTEHDVQIIVTEQGLADLRGLSPKQRAKVVIENCAHPDYRPGLAEYFAQALAYSPGKHTPHLMDEAFSWFKDWVPNAEIHKAM